MEEVKNIRPAGGAEPRTRIESLRHAADRHANVPKARPYSLLRVGESEGVSPSPPVNIENFSGWGRLLKNFS